MFHWATHICCEWWMLYSSHLPCEALQPRNPTVRLGLKVRTSSSLSHTDPP